MCLVFMIYSLVFYSLSLRIEMAAGVTGISLYDVRFSLVNKDNAAIASNANVTFAVKTKSGDDVLYSRNFSINSQDFQRYRFVITGFQL